MTGFPVLREPTAAPPQGFQWKWALLTIPIVVAVTVACMVVAVIVAGVLGTTWRILGEAAGNRMAVQRFLTEAKAIAAISHPHVIQIYN